MFDKRDKSRDNEIRKNYREWVVEAGATWEQAVATVEEFEFGLCVRKPAGVIQVMKDGDAYKIVDYDLTGNL